MEPIQQSKAQPGRDSVEEETRSLAAQHPLPDRPVPRAALTGKTGLPGASSKAEGAWPAQRSSWQWGNHNHGGWPAQPNWNSSGPSSLKGNHQHSPQYLPSAAHNIYVPHSHANSKVLLITLGSNHSTQSHTTFANSRITWGTCQLTMPAVHKLWLLTLMLQQLSLSLGLLWPGSLQPATPRQLIWLLTLGLRLGNRREPG